MSDTTLLRAGPAKCVLIVDDAGAITDSLRRLFRRDGHVVEIATDGQDALDKFRPGKYDLIITDYQMPGISGLELAEIIKRRDANQLILLVTAFAFTIAAAGANGLPVDFVLRKPFSVAELQSALAEVFKARAAGK